MQHCFPNLDQYRIQFVELIKSNRIESNRIESDQIESIQSTGNASKSFKTLKDPVNLVAKLKIENTINKKNKFQN